MSIRKSSTSPTRVVENKPRFFLSSTLAAPLVSSRTLVFPSLLKPAQEWTEKAVAISPPPRLSYVVFFFPVPAPSSSAFLFLAPDSTVANPFNNFPKLVNPPSISPAPSTTRSKAGVSLTASCTRERHRQ